MYDQNGSYGEVRLSHPLEPFPLAAALDRCTLCGWHRCNEQYRISRPAGANAPLILITLDGCGELEIAGRRRPVPAHHVAVIPRGVPHTYGVPAGGLWTFYWAHLTGRQVIPALAALAEEKDYVWRSADSAALAADVALLMELPGSTYADQLAAARTVSRLVFRLFDEARPPETPSSTLFAQILAYVQEHEDVPLDVRTLSAHFYLSEEHFIRLFRRYAGVPPYQWLKARRHRRACALLEHTDSPIGEIARAVGYRTTSGFIAAFRQTSGLSPAAYRRQYRLADAVSQN